MKPLVSHTFPRLDYCQVVYNQDVQSSEQPVHYAEVVVLIDAPGLHQPLTYSVPNSLSIQIGDAVLVPVGNRPAIGYVFNTHTTLPLGLAARIKPIDSLVEGAAAFDSGLRDLALRLQGRTLCELTDAVRLIAPSVLTSKIATLISIAPDGLEKIASKRLNPTATIILHALSTVVGPVDLKSLKTLCPGESAVKEIAALRKKGVVTRQFVLTRPEARQRKVRRIALAVSVEEAHEASARFETKRAPARARLLNRLIESGVPIPIPQDSAAAARGLVDLGLIELSMSSERRNPFKADADRLHSLPDLTCDQLACVKQIISQINTANGSCTLLYGVTGSGKTEVYLRAVAEAIRQGKGAIVALPEIGLTAQLLDLFKGRFGDETVAVLHSALSLGERFDEWIRIKNGEARIVLGARSAVFAPVHNLGLIILDEEHDASYKQDAPPRYHARDIALMRAQQTGAAILLGSATPSLESFWNAEGGAYNLIRLPERIDNRPLPKVHIVDLRAEFKLAAKDQYPGAIESVSARIFSSALRAAIGGRLESAEQVILFLNRRGFSPFLLCRDCGFSFRCPNCDTSLTFHLAAKIVRCHHCDYSKAVSGVCPKCEGHRLRPFGLGTEKIQEAVAELFPEARTLRMDRDTMARKGAHSEALRTFRKGGADILIGTQIVAKGLDFPNVTLVGVVSADTALNIPDFRTDERAFQLLTQVAGRAGRGNRLGEVFIQTFTPDHPSLLKAARHDYEGFYREEIRNRQELNYPPFSSLANFVFADEQPELALSRCNALCRKMREMIDTTRADAEILGPVACPVGRLRGRSRFHFILRGSDSDTVVSLSKSAVSASGQRELIGFSLDIDPLTML